MSINNFLELITKKYPLSSEREKIYIDLASQIGNTPLYEFTNLDIPNNNRIFGKLEYYNPTGSHHMRIYPLLFRIAESQQKIKPYITPVIEASIGNAGAAFVYSANKLGYNTPELPKVILPADASNARIEQLRKLNTDIIFSPSKLYSKGYVQVLTQMLISDKLKKGGEIGHNYERLVAITKILPEGSLAYIELVDEAIAQSKLFGVNNFNAFFGAIGSGSSISGIAKHLKLRNPELLVVASEPEEVPNAKTIKDTGIPLDLESNPQPVHGVATFGVPVSKLNIDFSVIDRFETFSNFDWETCQQQVLEKEKIPIGRSSAAVLASVLKFCKKESNKSILFCVYDEYSKSF